MTRSKYNTAFIDNVMVGIEIEKKYDGIVKEVLRRIVVNDLFKKCVQKVKEIGFLEVVIETDRIKMKKKKVLESNQLASAKGSEKYAEVFGIRKLLQMVC